MNVLSARTLASAVLSVFLSFGLLFFPVVPAANAQIVTDPSGKATIGPSSNGADVVNIAAPTASGVSHNKFLDYNVSESGVILNNSNFKNYNPHSKSELSGTHVEFNRNFGTGDAAKVILNEVTGNNISKLNGTTEIYGFAADLIIANPNGITCAGCGFINTEKLTMITGVPNMQGGEIKDFNISPVGILRVEGVGEERFGLDIANSAVLVSNLIELAGNINVRDDLSILAGNGVYDYASETVSSAGTGPVQVAVDAYAVGAMSAGNIRIHASQSGFGVNLSDSSIASADKIEITADGNIVFKDMQAESIKIASSGGETSQTAGGKAESAGTFLINSKDIDLKGSLSAPEVQISGAGDVKTGTSL